MENTMGKIILCRGQRTDKPYVTPQTDIKTENYIKTENCYTEEPVQYTEQPVVLPENDDCFETIEHCFK